MSDSGNCYLRNEVISALAKVSTTAPVNLDISGTTHLASLALDSLKLVEVIYELETTLNIEADEDLLAELTTVNDLVAAFEHGKN